MSAHVLIILSGLGGHRRLHDSTWKTSRGNIQKRLKLVQKLAQRSKTETARRCIGIRFQSQLVWLGCRLASRFETQAIQLKVANHSQTSHITIGFTPCCRSWHSGQRQRLPVAVSIRFFPSQLIWLGCRFSKPFPTPDN